MDRTYNRYNDVDLDTAGIPADVGGDSLCEMVRMEEAAWIERMARYTSERVKEDSAIMWLRLRPRLFSHLGRLCSPPLNFVIHHATPNCVMLVRRRSDASSQRVTNAPPYGTHYAKVECLVVETGTNPARYLMVREKYASGPDKYDVFKLVTGVMNLGERIDGACVREVLEETGVMAVFVGVIGVVQRIDTRFGRDELIFGCVLHAKPGQTPVPNAAELSCAFWDDSATAVTRCNEPALRWIKAAGRSRTENLLARVDASDLRGPPHFVSVFTVRR